MKAQRAADQRALEEAEAVLKVVEASESKYLKTARENRRLKSEISQLEDDNFWNDLDELQSKVKLAVELLYECKGALAKHKAGQSVDSGVLRRLLEKIDSVIDPA